VWGVILHAESAGEGAPVALLHGLFGRARNLAGVARGLAAEHRVISLDLRNHGASPHAPGMSYAAQAGDVMETLDALFAFPADLLGHSMGGKVAMACALAAPERVRRLLVADIAPVAYDHANAAIAAAMQALTFRAGMSRADVAGALARAVPDPAVRAFLAQNYQPGTAAGAAPGWGIGLDFIAAGIKEIQAWPAFPPGSRFEGPALFVAGDRSDYVRPAHHAVIRALFPAARFVVLADAGHWLHADQPAAFLEVARAFFT
jgi:pimeloyl-ACP methyl ester carboxylesterase